MTDAEISRLEHRIDRLEDKVDARFNALEASKRNFVYLLMVPSILTTISILVALVIAFKK